MRYVALLRGINVGGNKKIKMDDLKKLFDRLGFKNVKTLLAAGNVIFETEDKKDNLRNITEQGIEGKFGFSVSVILRTVDEIQKLVKSDPFRGVTVTPKTRLYVTFFGDTTKKANRAKDVKSAAFRTTSLTQNEICTVIDVEGGTVDMMSVLEKQFGKNITTRNWNTVVKIAQS